MSDASDIPWFKCYAAETLSDERFMGWTCEERGAFWTLLCLQWREGSIPGEHDTLRRFLHLDGPSFSGVWQAIGGRFAPSDAATGRLENPRMSVERREVLASIQLAKDTGRKGAAKRWHPTAEGNGEGNGPPIGPPSVPDGPPNARLDKTRVDQEQRRGGLPLREELDAARTPNCAALRVGLRGEGLDLSLPAADKRQAVEDAVARCGLAACIAACVEDARGMKEVPKSLGIFAGTLSALRPAVPPPDAGRWWTRLPRERLDAFHHERAEIDPDLEGAPPQALGTRHGDKIRALIARYETEARQ